MEKEYLEEISKVVFEALDKIQKINFNFELQKLEKEKIEPNENDSIIVPNTAVPSDFRNIRIGEVNNDLEIEEFAKLLAISLKDKDLRMYLKEEANKQFDGDYDILIGQNLEDKVGNSKFDEKI